MSTRPIPHNRRRQADPMQCGAKTRKGTPCPTPPVRGTTRCRMHGGSIPAVRRAAAWRLAEAAARQTLADQHVELIDDPLAAFQKLASEAVAFQEFTAGHVAQLREQLTGYDKDDQEYMRAVVGLYERAIDQAGKFLHAWVRLNMDERLVAVTERHADLIVQVITATLRDLGVDPDEEATRSVLGRHLRAIA